MPAKKRETKKTEPAADELEAREVDIEEIEPVKAAGPSETTEDKGADEVFWYCSHCDTRYPKDAKLAQANHLARVHPGA